MRCLWRTAGSRLLSARATSCAARAALPLWGPRAAAIGRLVKIKIWISASRAAHGAHLGEPAAVCKGHQPRRQRGAVAAGGAQPRTLRRGEGPRLLQRRVQGQRRDAFRHWPTIKAAGVLKLCERRLRRCNWRDSRGSSADTPSGTGRS